MSLKIILAAAALFNLPANAHESKCMRGLDSLKMFMEQKNITIAPDVRDTISTLNRGDKNAEFENFKSASANGQADGSNVRYKIPDESSAQMQNGPSALNLQPNSYRHVGEHFISESDLDTLTKYPNSPAAKQFFDKYKGDVGTAEQHSMQVGDIDKTMAKITKGDWKMGSTDERGWTNATVTVREGGSATKYRVVYCSKPPCSYASGPGKAGSGDILTTFPLCGPGVYNFTPPAKVFQSFCP